MSYHVYFYGMSIQSTLKMPYGVWNCDRFMTFVHDSITWIIPIIHTPLSQFMIVHVMIVSSGPFY